VAVPQTFFGNLQRSQVEGESFGAAGEQATRELVENDDQGEATRRNFEPLIQVAAHRSFERGGERRQISVESTSEPPF
jgi:hypothetical protein